ncbi:glycosyltransferase family 4 protein [Clostridium sp.]|uniref:glycosyltransferase family 4 protein n=1 Tax=Clostridium sp. TaxID=1506 RepID=UPI002907FDB4|nr:glycosyltransferase family 4 protein [Clostridium sp.]MDU7363122.1 glycosyltransferase family 4 protein [Clostridium sp.]
MNILILHAGAELYGADKVLLELLKNIDKSKYKPYVVLPCDGILVNELKKNKIDVTVIKYPILRRKYFNIMGLIKYIKDYIKYSIKLKKFAKEKEIDLIHTNTAAVLEGILLKYILKIPQIWHIHEIIVNPKIMHKVISFLIAKNSDEVVTVSNAVANHLNLTGYFKKNINVIYNGVDNNIFNPRNETDYLKKEFNISDKEIIVGMIGRVNSWKGQNDFIKALDIVIDKHKNVRGILVGGVFDGEEWRMEELESNIGNLRNKERVIISDYRSDTANVHNLFDIFVLPSINPDPLPTVVLEAMATAKPIIGYEHGGVCEMVINNFNGYFAKVRDIDDLSCKICKLIEEKNTRMKFSENSLIRQMEEFSLKSYVRNFEKIYDKYYK